MDLLLLLFLFLICFSALFSGSETAFFSLSQVDLHRFRLSKNRLAKRVVAALEKPRTMLVTILLGNELCNVSISIVGAALLSRIVPYGIEAQIAISVFVVTPVLLIFGEIIPKSIALKLAKPLAPVLIVPLQFFQKLVFPLQWLLLGFADGMIRLFGGEPESSEPMVMEQEYRHLIDIGSAEGAIEEEERELIHKVFEFTGKVVRDIMTPSSHLFMLPIDLPYERMLEEIRATHFSRIPIYKEARDEVIGILHVRDLFPFDRRRASVGEEEIRSILHKPIFVQGGESIEKVLRQFQEHRVHMAIVVDQKQHLLGVCTMHDVLEELFGEMEE